jgi:hypothetical protein
MESNALDLTLGQISNVAFNFARFFMDNPMQPSGTRFRVNSGTNSFRLSTLLETKAVPESQKHAVDKVTGLLFPNVPEFSAATENGKVN